MKPIGGTELQYNQLYKHVDNNLLNNFQITTSVPEKEPLSKDKINILWIQNSYDQPNVSPWFKDKSNHDKYDWYVFNSNWCFEKYRMFFDIPTHKSTVIKNAVDYYAGRTRYIHTRPIKMIFMSTPWRGLNVLLGAMQLIKNPLITCDVYSSTKIYGSSFDENNYKTYKPLFDQAESLPNVNFKGYATNDEILKNIRSYQIFAYPNIWEETSCIAAIEALSNGLHGIVTNFGALYETCADWVTYVPYQKNHKELAKLFAHAIEGVASILHEGPLQDNLDEQVKYYRKFYHWENRKKEWTQFLQGIVNSK